MRRTLGLVAALAVGLGAALIGPSPAGAATPSLRFHSAQYDSPGSDTGSNVSRNAEWISLVNTGSRAVNLSGYTIRDKAGKSYRFGSVSIAAKGGRLWLHTGSGTNSSTHRYWGSGNYVWNNTGDTAYLRNSRGAAVDSCAWTAKKNRTLVAC